MLMHLFSVLSSRVIFSNYSQLPTQFVLAATVSATKQMQSGKLYWRSCFEVNFLIFYLACWSSSSIEKFTGEFPTWRINCSPENGLIFLFFFFVKMKFSVQDTCRLSKEGTGMFDYGYHSCNLFRSSPLILYLCSFCQLWLLCNLYIITPSIFLKTQRLIVFSTVSSWIINFDACEHLCFKRINL